MNPTQKEALQKEAKDARKLIEKVQEHIEKTENVAKDTQKRIEQLQKTQKLIEVIPNFQPVFKELQSCIEKGQKHLKIWLENIAEEQNLLEELKKPIEINTNLYPRLALPIQLSAVTSGRDPDPCANQFMVASSSATHEIIDEANEVEAVISPCFKR